MCAYFSHRIVTHTTQPEKKTPTKWIRRCPINLCLGTWFYSTFTLFIPFKTSREAPAPCRILRFGDRRLRGAWALFPREKWWKPGSFLQVKRWNNKEVSRILHENTKKCWDFLKIIYICYFTDVVDVYIYIWVFLLYRYIGSRKWDLPTPIWLVTSQEIP